MGESFLCLFLHFSLYKPLRKNYTCVKIFLRKAVLFKKLQHEHSVFGLFSLYNDISSFYRNIKKKESERISLEIILSVVL